MDNDFPYPLLYAAAVADVVEAARWDARIKSIRELTRLAGKTHTYWNARKRGANPYDVEDLARLAPHIKLAPNEVLLRARQQLEAKGIFPATPPEPKKLNIMTSTRSTPRGGSRKRSGDAPQK